MSDYCNCNDFEKAVDYNDIRYYRVEDDRFNAVKRAGWYIRYRQSDLTYTFTVKRKSSSSKPRFHYHFLQLKRSSSQA